VLKSVWDWCSDSSGVRNPSGEPGRTPLYVDLPSAWVSVDLTIYFSVPWKSSLTGDSREVRMNE